MPAGARRVSADVACREAQEDIESGMNLRFGGERAGVKEG